MKFSSTPLREMKPLGLSASFTELVAFFQSYPDASLCPVVDYDGCPVGYVPLSDFQRTVASPFGHALNEKKGVIGMMRDAPTIVRLNDDVAEAFQSLEDRVNVLNSGLIVVDAQARYHGCLNAVDVFISMTQLHTEMLRQLKEEVGTRKQAENELKKIADTDALTGILNRRSFVKMVEARTTASDAFTLMFVDLDRFKPLNDHYGHAIGDLVLQHIAARLMDSKHVDLCCRLGGDEFAATIHEDRSAETSSIMEVIHGELTRPVGTSAGLVSVGASIGFAKFPADAEGNKTLLHAADKAMLRAKSNGGGVARFDHQLDVGTTDADVFEKAVTEAALGLQFRPAVQPIVSLPDQAIIGYEMLARWPNSPFASSPMPTQFVPALEKAGLLDTMFWSLMDQILAWLPADDTFISLNVSPSQLTSLAFCKRILKILEDHHVPPSRLQIEITEHVIFRELEESAKILHTLSDQGISLALDDFGIGYSSLSLLDKLPFSKVKLDRSLIQLSQDEKTPSRVMRAALRLCDELGLESCAEGVETQGQLLRLTAYGCRQAQGFFFGEPELCQPSEASDQRFAG
ncbi:MAG: EAL domain-containing protein [Henriciella sp.]|nr:EAL domain-containing protein [Henriciella sp.]